jgi:hypothetical protein
VSWAQWKRYWGEDIPEYLFQAADSRREGGTFTIATIRHCLYAIPEQFKRETKQGILRPIAVTNSEEPAFVIVPWEWYHLVTKFVKAHSVVPFRLSDEGVVRIDRDEVRDREDKAGNEEE